MLDKNKNEVKNEVKNKSKKIAKKLLIKALPFIIGFLIILMIASVVFVAFSAVIDVVKNLGQSIAGIFISNDSGIKLDENTLDGIIEKIEATGIDLDDLRLLRRY